MESPAELLKQNSSAGRPLRIAIISRRFWPFSGSTEFAVSDLASAIRRTGHHVEIVTVRWEKSWPQNFQFREFPVRRINRPLSGAWGSFRYLRNLIRYLNEIQPDGIIVFGLGEESWTIAKSFGSKTPLVIRIDNHVLGCRDGKANLNQRQITALNAANQVIVESQWTAERLRLNPAVKQARIEVVTDGITIDHQHQRSIARQGAARVAISDAHPMLMIESTQPLVVCGSPMNGDPGMIDLVNAWPAIQQRFANAKLWIFGEGSQSRQVWDQIEENHLIDSVVMPGSFDHLSVVFAAADIYVHPLRSDQTCGFLARAQVSGVCCVATATGANRPMIDDDVNGILVPAGDRNALTSGIIRGLSNVDLRDRLGRAAMKSSAPTHDVDKLLPHFLRPIVEFDQQTLGSSDVKQTTNSTSLP
jgi:glycosyltransferase involved in cell wall biosynthesis